MTINDRIFIWKATLERRKRDLAITGLLLLVGSLAFALGYSTGQNAHRTPIIIQKCSKAAIE